MRIGIDIRNIGKQRTGDEVVFFNLVKNLAMIDPVNNYKLLTDIVDAGKIQEISRRLGIGNKPNFEIVSLPTRNKFTWNLLTLPKYLRENPVEVYHTQYITPFFVSKKIKIATHIHDVSFRAFPRHIAKADLFFLDTLIPLSLKRADAIIAVSDFTKKEIVRYYGIPEEKIHVVPNALPQNFSEAPVADPEHHQELREKYGLPEKYILYIGTFQPRKNIPALIEAYARIRNRLERTKLVLVGNRHAHNADLRIEEAIRRLGLEKEIIFPGFIDNEDLPGIMGMAHVFATPSDYEGFGIPILEAMSRSVPVLASDIPSFREVGADAAIYASTSDLAIFSEKLYNISVNDGLRKSLIEAGLGRVNRFSWKISAEKLLGIYTRLV